MKKTKPLSLFKNRFQLLVFITFWIGYLIINIITTQFFKDETFSSQLVLQNLLYALGGSICSYLGYMSIKSIRPGIKSNLIFLFLSVGIVYIASFIWAIAHHLSWWMVLGDEMLIIKLSVYPVKALIFSTIILAAVLLLILAASKELFKAAVDIVGNKNSGSNNDENLINTEALDYNGTILLPQKNKVHNIRIDSIKLIQANDYYSNVITDASEQKVLSKNSLKKWELILPKDQFVRVHRSSIANLNFIENIEKLDNNTYELKIKGLQQHVAMSRRCAKEILGKFQPKT